MHHPQPCCKQKAIGMIAFFKKLFGGNNTDFKALVAGGAIIIDVRSAAEFASGNLKGSRNMPLNTLKGKLTELKKTGKPVIAVCASGIRSGMAKVILAGEGVEVYNGGSWMALQSKI